MFKGPCKINFLASNKHYKRNIMKNQYITTAWLALAITGSASAANITWQPPQAISASTDINTQGTLVTGHTCVDTAITVSGVTFVNSPPNFTASSLTGSYGFMGDYSYIGTNDSEGQNYALLLSAAWGTSDWGSDPMTLTFSNLTFDQDYLVQFWVADYRNYPGTDFERTLTLTGGSNESSALVYMNSGGDIHGSYVIGTFRADDVSQTIAINSNVSTQMNAVQLRAIPEPSAALLGGLGMLALLRRRRESLAKCS